jgi:viroplasmin and RNaseH domain-containing protein
MPAGANKKKAVAALAAANEPVSKKRKMSSATKEVKYYGVRAGKSPGVYLTWAECQAQISQFKGAQCEFAIAEPASDGALLRILC